MKPENRTDPSVRGSDEVSEHASKQNTVTIDEVLLWEAT